MDIQSRKSEKPYVPAADVNLPELTWRGAAFWVIVMAVVLGAANAYLGLRGWV